MSFFKERYFRPGTTDQEWRRIDAAWVEGASELALRLDSVTNNTSLALAIELEDHAQHAVRGRVLGTHVEH